MEKVAKETPHQSSGNEASFKTERSVSFSGWGKKDKL